MGEGCQIVRDALQSFTPSASQFLDRAHTDRQAFQSGDRRVFQVPSFGTAVILLTVVLGAVGAARAENECGRPEAGTPIVCSPSNYDADAEGNIVYRLTKAHSGNVVVRFVDGLSIRYDLDNPDDRLFFSGTLSDKPLYSAVRVETDADYEGDISLFSSADVTSNGRGISVAHQGKSGALHTEISGGTFSIDSKWSLPHTIHSYRGDGYDTDQEFSGAHDLIVRNVSIDSNVSTDEESAWNGGIVGVQVVEGDLNVAVQDSNIKGNGRWVAGVAGIHDGNGNIDIDVQKVDIDVSGTAGSTDGVFGYHLGRGDSNVRVQDADIKVRGDRYSNGIAYGYWRKNSVGDLSVDARDVNIQVHGKRYLDGIFGIHRGTGNIDVDVHRAKIDIVAKDADAGDFGDSGGIAFVHDGTGPIAITARDVGITVQGDRSVGIGGGQRYEGTGDIAINVHDSTVTVTGEKVAGIRSFNFSGKGDIDVHVDGGTITAKGPGSSGILVGLTGRKLPRREDPIKAPAGVTPPTVDQSGVRGEGVRPQRVVVNGRVWGGSPGGEPDESGGPPVVGAGVRLYGGGQVDIGPRGSIGADSGVAIRAEAEGAELHVAFNGRRPSEAITGEIRNDDGRTTITVNGVELHNGSMGATRLRAPNGARDVFIESSETIRGRMFRLTDFVSSYAPRSAVFETLPGFMLRLDQGEDTAGKRLRIPGSPAWIKVSGGQGSYKPDRSHVGATYDFNRFETEVGAEFGFSQDQNMTGWAALRYVNGSADVSASTGGGRIDASGFGGAAGVAWENTAGYYASGSVSLTRYDTDLRADGQGLLKDDVGATVRSIGVEAGRRFPLSDHLSITPQAWLTHSEMSMESFQDAVGSRVSLREATQSIAGLGVVTETTYVWDGGERTLDLRGRLGVERVLGDGETVVEVSGEPLGSEADRTRFVLGLGAVVHWSRWSLGGEVSASALGSDDNHYAASLRLGTQF